jgi:PTS system glucitol/sorbitol-specific IIC component
MDLMIQFAENFTALFNEGGAIFIDLLGGLIPSIIVLMTFLNAITKIIGEKNITKLSIFLSKSKILSYTVLPFVGWFFFTNPMAFTLGRFLPRRSRASYIDAVSTTNGPMLSLFPHVNPAEIFVWLGIASGVEKLGISIMPLAIRFLIAGYVLAFVRAMITEWIWVFLAKREGLPIDDDAIIVGEEVSA